jgi:hypothetical protein
MFDDVVHCESTFYAGTGRFVLPGAGRAVAADAKGICTDSAAGDFLDCPHFSPVFLRTPAPSADPPDCGLFFASAAAASLPRFLRLPSPPELFLPHHSPVPSSASSLPFLPSAIVFASTANFGSCARFPPHHLIGRFLCAASASSCFFTSAQLRNLNSIPCPALRSCFGAPRWPPQLFWGGRVLFSARLLLNPANGIGHGVDRAIDGPPRRRRLRPLSQGQDQMRLRERPSAVQELRKGHA